MWAETKRRIKDALRYPPLAATAGVRDAIETVRAADLPYCPPDEGDLIHSLIRANGYADCLEAGFHTGSSALYMAAAVADRGGRVTSVCVDDDATVARGLALLRAAGHDGRHRLVRMNSTRALAEMMLADERFDFVYMDGWKTFDHLAFEMYAFNQLLRPGGAIVFDDSFMPSVRRAIRLLRRYYGYAEIDYAAHGQTWRLRLFQALSRRSPWRPYRALVKTRETAAQAPFRDLHFDRRLG